MEPLPLHLLYSGYFAPLTIEGEATDLPVTGKVPDSVRGTLFRNGPNARYRPLAEPTILDGDGMIHAIRFADDGVHYRNRWVRTRKFQLEAEARRGLFGTSLHWGASDPEALAKLLPPGPDPADRIVAAMDVANTNAVFHAGRLLALEEVVAPYAVDPSTLETIGHFDFDGALPGPMTAHPVADPSTGELHLIGYRCAPPYLHYGVVGPDGRLRGVKAIDVPYGSMMHDFLVTDRHVVFGQFPAVFDESFVERDPVRWQPERGAWLGIMPRGVEAAQPTWIAIDPCYVFHWVNAYEDGATLVVDGFRYDRLPVYDGAPEMMSPQLWRWRVDLDAGTAEGRCVLPEHAGEFPRFDDRFRGKPYRYIYVPGWPMGSNAMALFSQIQRVDLSDGSVAAHRLRPGCAAGEVLFVPSSPDPPEGIGHLLCLVYDMMSDRSSCYVLDAERVEEPPVAVVQLPQRVPAGFHGNFVPARLLP